jgi:twitching motility protein PilT
MAMALAAMLTQTLLPRRLGGRIPAAELLMVGYGARQHIRKNALQHLHQEITITRKNGSFTLEEWLAQLVVRGDLSREDALVRAIHPEDLDAQLKARGFLGRRLIREGPRPTTPTPSAILYSQIGPENEHR